MSPPQTTLEVIERITPGFRGWYTEATEGASAPYPREDDPAAVRALVQRIKDRFRKARHVCN